MNQRLLILKENNVISEEVFDFTLDVYQNIFVPLKIGDSKLETFITHLAMASQRILNKDLADDMDESIFSEIRNSEHYGKAENILNKILAKSGIEFPGSEKKYLLLHLVNVIEKGGGESDD